jgi:hypothetical protein
LREIDSNNECDEVIQSVTCDNRQRIIIIKCVKWYMQHAQVCTTKIRII